MRAMLVVILLVFQQPLTNNLFAEGHHEIEQLFAQSANETLRDSILPRAGQLGANRAHTESAFHKVSDIRIQLVVIRKQKPQSMGLAHEGGDQPLHNPLGCGMGRDVNSEQTPSLMLDYEKPIQRTLPETRNHKEIHSGDIREIQPEKIGPAQDLAGVRISAGHILSHSGNIQPHTVNAKDFPANAGWRPGRSILAELDGEFLNKLRLGRKGTKTYDTALDVLRKANEELL